MKDHVRIIDKNKKVGPAHVVCVDAIHFDFFDSGILRQLLWSRGSRKSKNGGTTEQMKICIEIF